MCDMFGYVYDDGARSYQKGEGSGKGRNIKYHPFSSMNVI